MVHHLQQVDKMNSKCLRASFAGSTLPLVIVVALKVEQGDRTFDLEFSAEWGVDTYRKARLRPRDRGLMSRGRLSSSIRSPLFAYLFINRLPTKSVVVPGSRTQFISRVEYAVGLLSLHLFRSPNSQRPKLLGTTTIPNPSTCLVQHS